MESLHAYAPPPCESLCGDRILPDRLVDGIFERLAAGESLAEGDTLNRLVQDFADPRPLDSYATVCCLASSSQFMAGMLSGRTGVREGYRLHEHTQAVLNGLEADHLFEYPDERERVMLRTALLLQDIGKSLCIGHCGDRHQQAPYNAAVRENLFLSVTEETLSDVERQAIRLLLDHDTLGAVLKGYKGVHEVDASTRIKAIERMFPEEHRGRFLDLMRTVYLSDVTAYTSFRTYVAAETGERTACQPALNETHQVLTLGVDGRVAFVDPARNEMLARLTTRPKS